MSLQTVPLYRYYAVFTTLLKIFVSRAEENSSIIRFSVKIFNRKLLSSTRRVQFQQSCATFSATFYEVFLLISGENAWNHDWFVQNYIKTVLLDEYNTNLSTLLFLLKVQTPLLFKLRRSYHFFQGVALEKKTAPLTSL